VELERLRPRIRRPRRVHPWTYREASWALLALVEAVIIFGLLAVRG
jgi:hypothetical protein